MSLTPKPVFLSIDRAMEFIGDTQGVLSLLKTLHQTLSNDLPRLQILLDRGDVYGANRILHQLKGFTPVFCVDSLVEHVVRVEDLTQGIHHERELLLLKLQPKLLMQLRNLLMLQQLLLKNLLLL